MVKKITDTKKLVVSGQVQFVVETATNDVYTSNLTNEEINALEDDLIGFDIVSAVDAACQKSKTAINDTSTLSVLTELCNVLNTQ